MALQESGEMYLETIYILSQKSDRVRSLDVAEYMGFSKPSVSRAVSLLKEGEYITADSKGYLHLTEKGTKVAETMFERHTLLASFLERLGVPKKIASEDACKIEHHISIESFDAIKSHAEKFIKK